MTDLLDGNVLAALVLSQHVHHDRAVVWFVSAADRFATCPITQGTLLRLLLRNDVPTAKAFDALARVVGHERHEFWRGDLTYLDVDLGGVVTHRQVTDAYLAQLARSRRGRLITFDRGLAELHRDVAVVAE
jgi:toxin-antitoxin system PIN domain toxin